MYSEAVQASGGVLYHTCIWTDAVPRNRHPEKCNKYKNSKKLFKNELRVWGLLQQRKSPNSLACRIVVQITNRRFFFFLQIVLFPYCPKKQCTQPLCIIVSYLSGHAHTNTYIQKTSSSRKRHRYQQMHLCYFS